MSKHQYMMKYDFKLANVGLSQTDRFVLNHLMAIDSSVYMNTWNHKFKGNLIEDINTTITNDNCELNILVTTNQLLTKSELNTLKQLSDSCYLDSKAFKTKLSDTLFQTVDIASSNKFTEVKLI